MKVRNMESDNGGAVVNPFIIEHGKFTYFQSFASIIVRIDRHTGAIVLDRRYWDYSKTTRKYRNQFLGEGIAETRAKIKSGVYKLADLNK